MCTETVAEKAAALGVNVDVTHTHTQLKNTGGVQHVLRLDSIKDVSPCEQGPIKRTLLF